MADAKRRRDLSVQEKINILQEYDKLPKVSQRDAAIQLKISQPLLCKILKNRVQIESDAKQNDNLNTKRKRTGKDSEVEYALKQWFNNVRKHDEPVDSNLMRRKAEDLAKKMGKEHFVATKGWFRRWKKRENIVYKQTHNEQTHTDFNSAPKRFENEWRKVAPDFTPDNVFNAGETGLYYRAIPDHMHVFKSENNEECELLKEHVTILCCANMSGDKEKLVVIGKNKNPLCFKGTNNLPVHYYSNSKSWMTSLIFNEWLSKWDNKLDRKIALLVNNSPVHKINCQLKNIKVIILPLNTTSLIPPCDRGILTTLKAYYRKEMFTRILENLEDTQNTTANDLAKETTLLEVLHLLAMSWSQVCKTTIKNSFKHVSLAEEHIEKEITEENLKPSDMTENEFEEWMAIDDNIDITENVTEEDICKTNTQLNENPQQEEQSDIETMKPPTNKDMRKALEVLRLGVQYRAFDFQTHYQYEIFINNLLRDH